MLFIHIRDHDETNMACNKKDTGRVNRRWLLYCGLHITLISFSLNTLFSDGHSQTCFSLNALLSWSQSKWSYHCNMNLSIIYTSKSNYSFHFFLWKWNAKHTKSNRCQNFANRFTGLRSVAEIQKCATIKTFNEPTNRVFSLMRRRFQKAHIQGQVSLRQIHKKENSPDAE